MIPGAPGSRRQGLGHADLRRIRRLDGVRRMIVLPGLKVRRHAAQFQGEADSVVLVPGCGIVVIESKSPEYGSRTELMKSIVGSMNAPIPST